MVGIEYIKLPLLTFFCKRVLKRDFAFSPTSPCMSSWPSSHLPLLGCTSGWGLPIAQVYCSWVDALQRGHLFKPRHMLKPVPHSEVSEVVYTWSPPILVRSGVSEERLHTSHCVIRPTPKLTCRSEVFYRKKGLC